MAGEDRYDLLLLKAEGKQSDRHDEAFDAAWDELEKGFFESFGRGRKQAQARQRAMPAALEAMTARRNAALAPAVRTIGGTDSKAPLQGVVEQPESVVNTTEPYKEKDVITDGDDNDEDPVVVANEEEAEVDQKKVQAYNDKVNRTKVESQQAMRANEKNKKSKKEEEPKQKKEKTFIGL